MSFEKSLKPSLASETPIDTGNQPLDIDVATKQNHEVQTVLKQTLIEKIKRAEIIDEEQKVATEETLQKALGAGLKEAIKYGRDINQHLKLATEETLQKALKQGLRERLIRGQNIDRYLLLATEQTVEKIKQDQKLIGVGLTEAIKNGIDIDGEYINLATEETLRESLELGLKERIVKGQNINKYLKLATGNTVLEAVESCLLEAIKDESSIDKYLELATEETLQKALKRGVLERSIRGLDIEQCLKLITEETKESLLKDIEQLKQSVIESAGLFFKDNFRFKIEKQLKEVVGSLSREQIWNALFDHTTLPVGIKFHVPNNTPLSQMLNKTGGFVAHGEEQCFVANPLHNQTLVTIVFDAMEKYLRENNSSLEDVNYIQTCCLGRLPNKESGIATLAFLMVKDKKEQIDSKTLVHGQNVFGVTIPDGGNIKEDYIIPNEDMGFSKPTVKERTDMLFCRDRSEVLLANDLLTLLNHSSLETDKSLLFKKLGEQFITEVVSLLKQHDLIEDFKKTTFINARNEDIPKLLELIEKIKELRLGSEELLEKIKKANGFVLHSDNEEEIEQVRSSYESLVKEYKNTLPYKLAILVEKYRNSMKPEGLTRLVIEDEWQDNES